MVKRYAIVANGVVENVAVSEAPLSSSWIESADAAVGDLYDGTVFSKPITVPDKQDVTDYAEELIEVGVTINVTGIAAPVYVQGRDKDTRNVQGLVTAATLRLSSGDTTTLTDFRDGNNVTHQLVPAQVVEMWQKSAAYVSAVYAASWNIKDASSIASDFQTDARWPDTDQTI